MNPTKTTRRAVLAAAVAPVSLARVPDYPTEPTIVISPDAELRVEIAILDERHAGKLLKRHVFHLDKPWQAGQTIRVTWAAKVVEG